MLSLPMIHTLCKFYIRFKAAGAALIKTETKATITPTTTTTTTTTKTARTTTTTAAAEAATKMGTINLSFFRLFKLSPKDSDYVAINAFT